MNTAQPDDSATLFLDSTNQVYFECEKGIENLDKIIISTSSRYSGLAKSYLFPILYAYWERFFKLVFSEFYRCYSLKKIGLTSTHPKMAALRLKRELSSHLKLHSISQIQEIASHVNVPKAKSFFDYLNTFCDLPVSFNEPDQWVDTESNVNFYVVRKNCENIGVDIEKIKSDLEESGIILATTLKKLVDARNDIAHGTTFKLITSSEWNEIKSSLFSIMTALQLELYEKLSSE